MLSNSMNRCADTAIASFSCLSSGRSALVSRFSTIGVEASGSVRRKRSTTMLSSARTSILVPGGIEEATAESGKDEAAQALGRKGGAARRDKLTRERGAEIARAGAGRRWGHRTVDK